MPIALVAIGALFLIAAVRGTISDYDNGKPGLLTLLKDDFVSTQAKGNFLIWLVTLWIIGALGYIPGFKPVANALLFLVLLVMFLSNSKNSGTGGIFAEFNAALTSNNSTGSLQTATPTDQSTMGMLTGLSTLQAMVPMTSNLQPMTSGLSLFNSMGGYNG